MHPHSRHHDRRDEYKQLFKNQTAKLGDKRKIGKKRQQEFLDEYFPIQKSEEQIKYEEEMKQVQAAEEEKKKQLNDLKDSLLKKSKKAQESQKEEDVNDDEL